MTSAALAISGFDGGSNFSRYRRPSPSTIVKPGVMPSAFAEVTRHTFFIEGGVVFPGPRCSSSVGHSTASVPVRIPFAVGDLTQCVHTASRKLLAGLRWNFTRLEHQVLEEIVVFIDSPRPESVSTFCGAG